MAYASVSEPVPRPRHRLLEQRERSGRISSLKQAETTVVERGSAAADGPGAAVVVARRALRAAPGP